MIHKIDLQMRNRKLKPKLIADPRQQRQKLIGHRMVSLNTRDHQLNINLTHNNKIERSMTVRLGRIHRERDHLNLTMTW